MSSVPGQEWTSNLTSRSKNNRPFSRCSVAILYLREKKSDYIFQHIQSQAKIILHLLLYKNVKKRNRKYLLNIIVQKFPILQYQLKSDNEGLHPFLRASAKLQKATINFILSVHTE
jgi:hypothetical protein